jgi:hypothetical protein
MPFVTCPQHGPSPGQQVCEHLHADFFASLPLRPFTRIPVLLRDYDPPDYEWFSVLLCSECRTQIGILDSVTALYEDEVETRYQQFYRMLVLCSDCITDQANSNATGSA